MMMTTTSITVNVRGTNRVTIVTTLILVTVVIIIWQSYGCRGAGLPDSYVSYPSNIPLFEFDTPTIAPGTVGKLEFSIKNRYNRTIENVKFELEMYSYEVVLESKRIAQVEHAPRFIESSGNSVCMVHRVVFNYAEINSNMTVNDWVKIRSESSSPEGAYLVRTKLEFELNDKVYIMKSRLHFSSSVWAKFELEGNLSLLGGCAGVIPDTSFSIRAPPNYLVIYTLGGLAGFFGILAVIFYLMDEYDYFPNAKRKLDTWAKFIKRKLRGF